MKLWLDAQLSPEMASWIAKQFAIEVVPVRDVGLRDASDVQIFEAAKQAAGRQRFVRPNQRGRLYEDFEVGDVYEHPLGRTVLAADDSWFTLLTMNTVPLANG